MGPSLMVMPDARGTPTYPIDRHGPSPDLAEDRAVVARVLAGDREAFRILVDREGAAVIRACSIIGAGVVRRSSARPRNFIVPMNHLAGSQWYQRMPLRKSAGKR